MATPSVAPGAQSQGESPRGKRAYQPYLPHVSDLPEELVEAGLVDMHDRPMVSTGKPVDQFGNLIAGGAYALPRRVPVAACWRNPKSKCRAALSTRACSSTAMVPRRPTGCSRRSTKRESRTPAAWS